MQEDGPGQALVPVGAAPRGVVDVATYERDGVDPETGRIKLPEPPNAKLTPAGKNKICELIVEGLKDAEVVRALVDGGFVTSYTEQAVKWWRSRPQVQAFLEKRTSQAFQTGLSARSRRIVTLGEITQAMIRANFDVDDTGKVTRFRQTEDPKGLSGQAAMVQQIRQNFQEIGHLVGDSEDPKRLMVGIVGTVTHEVAAARLGFGELADADLDKMLADAGAAMPEYRQIEAAAADRAIEGQFAVIENAPEVVPEVLPEVMAA